jgi:hypothetical protein
MGGHAPSDLLIPKTHMEELAKNPLGFVMAVALPPDYKWDIKEVNEMERTMKKPPGPNRQVRGPTVTWTTDELGKEAIWAGKAQEGVLNKVAYTMGGCGSFWPFPLQRQGGFSTLMWKISLPEGYTATWLDYMGRSCMKSWQGAKFWTLTKR